MRNPFYITVFFILFIHTQCSRKDIGCISLAEPKSGTSKFNYGDSVFYLQASDYVITPMQARVGTYTAFPDNLKMDVATGKITVTVKGTDGASQTGLWYKIKYKSSGTSEVDSTNVLIGGITYVDKFYNLSQGDSIIYPFYNGDPLKAIPPGNYDLQQEEKFAVNPANGQINIRESARRGFFKTQPSMGWKKASIKYTINDKSNRSTNGIDIILYYYSTLADVPSNVTAIMQAHQRMTLGFRTSPITSTFGALDNNLPRDLSLLKPRPPCLVIIGH